MCIVWVARTQSPIAASSSRRAVRIVALASRPRGQARDVPQAHYMRPDATDAECARLHSAAPPTFRSICVKMCQDVSRCVSSHARRARRPGFTAPGAGRDDRAGDRVDVAAATVVQPEGAGRGSRRPSDSTRTRTSSRSADPTLARSDVARNGIARTVPERPTSRTPSASTAGTTSGSSGAKSISVPSRPARASSTPSRKPSPLPDDRDPHRLAPCRRHLSRCGRLEPTNGPVPGRRPKPAPGGRRTR